jgi:hypothetical protein
LLGGYAAVPALAALYGLRRGGAEGAMAGAIAGLIGASVAVLDAAHLVEWWLTPKRPSPATPDRLYWTVAALLAATAMGAAVVVLGAFDPAEEHGLDGWLDGLVAGVVCAALCLFLAARIHGWLTWLRGPTPAIDIAANRSALQAALAPTLTELEAVRVEAGRRIRRRAAWLTPIGAGGLLCTWAIWLALTHDLNLLAPPAAVLVGGLIGHVVAAHRLAGEYERLYEARVLPRLAAMFGALTFGRPRPPDLERLRRFHVFRRFDDARADDAVMGAYRGLQLSIVQLRLTSGWGPMRRQGFRGLLVEVELERHLPGVTAVAADAGPFGAWRDALTAHDVRRVGLESPAFEREYEVYATDQVIARTLVTPQFMERFPALGQLDGFGRPLALAADDRLTIALPRAGAGGGPDDYFAPPGYDAPANDDAVLGRLYRDIAAVLAVADAVIGVDEQTSRDAAPPPAPPGPDI